MMYLRFFMSVKCLFQLDFISSYFEWIAYILALVFKPLSFYLFNFNILIEFSSSGRSKYVSNLLKFFIKKSIFS